MNIFEDLEWRGLINNVTNKEKLERFIINKGTAYIGFDPSADSLHLGNYIMLLVLKRLKLAGFGTIAVLGGATGQIGDPSGKKSERVMLDVKQTALNASHIEKQIKKVLDIEVFNNVNIYQNMTIFDFLRSVGKLINVNYLLEKDIIKSRLESGISYAEFSYNLIQGYDFAWLYTNKNVTMQIGGSDQWGNITTGIEMIRKLVGDNNDALGFTTNLLTKADGTKFGKSEGGAIYLDKKKTSPFNMYQFLYNQEDSQIEKLLKFFTLLPKEKIEEIMVQHNVEPYKRIAQKALVKEVLVDIHGEKEYQNCLRISDAFFNGNLESLSPEELYDALASTPTTKLNEPSYNIVELLVAANIVDSKSNGRKLLSSNAIHINGKLYTDFTSTITKKDAINNHFSYIKKGKKNYYLLIWS